MLRGCKVTDFGGLLDILKLLEEIELSVSRRDGNINSDVVTKQANFPNPDD